MNVRLCFRSLRLASAALALAGILGVATAGLLRGQTTTTATMPLDSRRAWNRVALFHSNLGLWPAGLPEGQHRARVLLLAKPGTFDDVSRRAAARGGTTEFADERTGYLRVVIPAADLASFVAQDAVASWQLDGEASTHGDRYYERGRQVLQGPKTDASRVIDAATAQWRATLVERGKAIRARPVAPRELTEQYPYRPDARMGIDRLHRDHPTFDGRGATVAIVESGASAIRVWHPLLRDALTVAGRRVRKVATLDLATDFESPGEYRTDPVKLSPRVLCESKLCAWGGERYIVPAPGRYRFGVWSSESSKKPLALLREDNGLFRIDVDGDGDLGEEQSVRDFNTCETVDCGRFSLPGGDELILTEDLDGRGVIVHGTKGSHPVMCATVSAGSPGPGTYGRGVAPGARVVLVSLEDDSLHFRVEALIRAARMRHVDVISMSTQYLPQGATTDGFAARALASIVSAYGKPIVIAAGNNGGGLSSEITAGGASALIVGSLSLAETVKAVAGVSSPQKEWVSADGSSRGPTLDGALAPDFVVPNRRVSGTSCSETGRYQALGEYRLPSCYGFSDGTSAAAPTAAGLIALLISGLKQEGRSIDVDRLLWAMRASGSGVLGVPVVGQGLGVPQIDEAWRLYVSDDAPAPILVEAPVRHAMDAYLTDRDRAPGLFEREGWTVGQRGERTIMLRRDSDGGRRTAGGRDASETPASTFRLTLRGDDAATFRVPSRITLPIGERVAVPVAIAPRRAGLHAAIVEVRDEKTGTPVAFVPLTVIAGQELTSGTIVDANAFGPLAGHFSFVRVPAGTGLMRLDLEVLEGAAGLEADLPSGRNFSAPEYLMPFLWTHSKPVGNYTLLIPQPEPGTWGWTVKGHSGSTADPVSRSRYRLTMTASSAQLESHRAGNGREVDVRLARATSNIQRPAILAETGVMLDRILPFRDGAVPTVVPITVPEGTLTMIVEAAPADPRRGDVEMTVYDCTPGHCSIFDQRVPASATPYLRMTRPAAGLWKVIVTPGPRETPEKFSIKTVLTDRQADVRRVRGRTAWIVTPRPAAADARSAHERSGNDSTPVVFAGLVDEAAEEAERLHPFGLLDALTTRPAFIATDVVPLTGDRLPSATAARRQ